MFDKNTASQHFCEILRHKTTADNAADFGKFRKALAEMYPLIHEKCTREILGKGIIYHWKGRTSEKSIVLMSHYDVVPADDSGWDYPPFSGTDADGRFWSRGAIDTKCTLCAILESAETLISRGFIPNTDIYMCFGGDEETDGSAAIQIAAELERRGITPHLILDEGGAIVDGSEAGIKSPCALVGIAEKGYMDVEFITRGGGGHSSLTSDGHPIAVMAEVITRLECGIFKPYIAPPVKIMLKHALKHANFKYRIILRNYWFWGILFRKIFLKRRPEINALFNSIGTITQISGGNAENVIAEQVRAVGNFRIVNSVDETMGVIKKSLSGLKVEINLISGLEPSAVSEIHGEGWSKLNLAISQTWKESVAIPYLMLARSDSRSYSSISRNIYRFSPITLTKEERRLIHGVNENISKENFYKTIEFYIRLISN